MNYDLDKVSYHIVGDGDEFIAVRAIVDEVTDQVVPVALNANDATMPAALGDIDAENFKAKLLARYVMMEVWYFWSKRPL